MVITATLMGRHRASALSAAQALKDQVAALVDSARAASTDDQLSDAGRLGRVQSIATNLGDVVRSWHANQMDGLNVLLRLTQQDLDKTRDVPAEAMAARSASLKPVIDNATTNPAGLLAALERNYQDLPARRLLEETIASTYDALADPVARTQLAESYQRVQDQLAPLKPEAEQAAEERLNQARQIAGYVGQVAYLADLDATKVAALDDTNLVASQKVRAASLVEVANTRHAVAMYERQVDPVVVTS